MGEELVDVSIIIGNSSDESLLQSHSKYNLNVNNNIKISGLKENLINIFDDEVIKNMIREYKIYNNFILELGDDEIISEVSNDYVFFLLF